LTLIAAIMSAGQDIIRDVNEDGVIDSLTVYSGDNSEVGCGAHGCYYQAKISNGKKSKFDTTTIFLLDGAFVVRLLRNGTNQLYVYNKVNGFEGTLERFELHKNTLRLLSKRHLKPNDNEKDELELDSIFGWKK
jgi:hypothetical protein